jgi:membrane-associated phospholipid phosphatase
MIKNRKDFYLLFFLLFFYQYAFAQNTQLNHKYSDSVSSIQFNTLSFKNERIKPISFIIPASMVAYGVWAVNNDYLKKFDQRVNKEIFLNSPHPALRIDDYLQYTPAAVTFGLNAIGIKGKHKMIDAGAIYLMSNAIMSGIVVSIKKTTPVMRPDMSNNNSFPSGHTAAAFVSAEFLLREYIDVSPWIGIAGYGAAFLTGYLRMYNNKHWFSDVVAGAGIGVISTKLAYLLYNQIKPRLLKNKGKNTIILPSYQNGSWGVNLVKMLE